jgi:hypothetical protein
VCAGGVSRHGTYTIGFAALEASRAALAPHSDAASGIAPLLGAYTTPGQFHAGLRHLLEGISSHMISG